jgi:hypothetical protein
MSATAKSLVGLGQGEHRAGFANITIDWQAVDNALSGTRMMEAGAHAERLFPAITTPIVSPKLPGDRLTFVLTKGPTTMGLRLTSANKAIVEPLLAPAQFKVNDPDRIKAREGPQIKIRKAC